jgi:hypothetical protein
MGITVTNGGQGGRITIRSSNLGGRTTVGSPSLITSGSIIYVDASVPASYPGTGTTWTDLSGNSKNGTLTNGPTFNSANGGSIVFDGTNDYAVFPITNLGSNGTVSLWIYKTGNGTPDGGGVVDLLANLDSGGISGWSIGMNVNTSKIDFYIANNGGFGVENFSTSSISSNVWYNVACTYNGASKIIYINGVQDASNPSTVNGINITGQWGMASRITGQRFFQGRIANAQVYTRALSANEIQQNYNAFRLRFLV